jgi:phosphate transport system substrate-binding protein
MQPRGKKNVTLVGGVAALAVALAACSSSTTPSSGSSASSSPSSGSSSVTGTLNGAGSTFQTNFQQAAISAIKSVDPGITVNYSSVGSGTGRDDLAAGTVNYAGSDSPIPSADASDFKKTVLYFPVQIGPIAIAYNLSGVKTLKLDATVLAGIFSGKITTWNNSAIAALNPGVSLPSATINVVVRSDSSGTTAGAAPGRWAPPRRLSSRRPSTPPTAVAASLRPSSPPPTPSATWTSPPRPPPASAPP